MADTTVPLPFDPHPGRATKRCRVCRKSKQLDEFYIRPETGRHRAECVACYLANRTANRDHEDNRRRVREWAKNNPEKHRAQTKRSYEKARSDLLRWVGYTLRNTRQYAKNKKIECTITPDEIKQLYERQAGKCWLTARELIFGAKGQQRDSISLDRIEIGGPYTIDNVRLVTHQANMARGPFSDEELRDFCIAHLTTIGYSVAPPTS